MLTFLVVRVWPNTYLLLNMMILHTTFSLLIYIPFSIIRIHNSCVLSIVFVFVFFQKPVFVFNVRIWNNMFYPLSGCTPLMGQQHVLPTVWLYPTHEAATCSTHCLAVPHSWGNNMFYPLSGCTPLMRQQHVLPTVWLYPAHEATTCSTHCLAVPHS